MPRTFSDTALKTARREWPTLRLDDLKAAIEQSRAAIVQTRALLAATENFPPAIADHQDRFKALL